MALKLHRKILCPECLCDFNHVLATSRLVHPRISRTRCSRDEEVIHLKYCGMKKWKSPKKVHTKPIGEGQPVIQIIYPMCRLCHRPTNTFKMDTLRCIFSHNEYARINKTTALGCTWTNDKPPRHIRVKCENVITVPIAHLIVWV